MIKASGALEIHELLRFVPGYFSYSVSGNQYAVTSHFGANDLPSRLEVRIDGRSVHQPMFDTVDWASLGLDVLDIDHIEVVRGSSASVYGSNAFLGAINIVTKGSLLQKHQTTIRATGGSIDTKNFSFNHADYAAGVEYFLSLNAKENTGFKPFTDGADNPKDKNIDSRRSLNMNLQGSYTPDVDNNFTFDIGLGTNDIEIPLRQDPRGFSNRVVKTNHQQLEWTRGSGKNQSKFTLNHNYYQIRDDASPGYLANLLGVLPNQVQFIFPGQGDQKIFLDKNKGFSERIDFVNVNLGFLAEKAESESTNISPRIALNYQIGENQTFRGSITRGLHAPSQVVSKAYSGLSCDDGTLINLFLLSPNNLKPEKITSYELAYLRKWPELKTKLDIKLFNENIEDIITTSNIAYTDIDKIVRTHGNNGFINNKGVELQLEHSFSSIPKLDMRLAYAFIDSEVRNQNAGIPFQLRNSIPKHSATLMINKKTNNGYDLSTNLQYQSDRDNQNEGILYLFYFS